MGPLLRSFNSIVFAKKNVTEKFPPTLLFGLVLIRAYSCIRVSRVVVLHSRLWCYWASPLSKRIFSTILKNLAPYISSLWNYFYVLWTTSKILMLSAPPPLPTNKPNRSSTPHSNRNNDRGVVQDNLETFSSTQK